MINMTNITTIYVSQKTGNNDFSGLQKEENGLYQGPVKTIDRALSRIADLRCAGAGQPIRIVVLDDVYVVEKPILITENVSRVTICSLNHSCISGGRQITGFKPDVFNNTPCFSAEVPKGWIFTDLFVDGKHADCTSFPKEGVFLPEAVEKDSPEVGDSSKWFVPKAEQLELLKKIKKLDECIISFNHYWIDEHTPIESIDWESGRVTFKYKSKLHLCQKNENSCMRYRIENAAEAFGYPNEWYLDREQGKVYYIPENESQTPENIVVYAPVVEKLFVVKGQAEKNVENITFANLTFAHTRGDYLSVWKKEDCYHTGIGRRYIAEEDTIYASDDQSVQKAPAAIEFTYAKSCGVERCLFQNLGIHGVAVEQGCSGARIYGNTFRNLGGGGVKVGGGAYGCEDTEKTYGCVISQNVITHCGNRYTASCGILLKHTFGNTISHNEINYLYYSGISVGWVWGYADSITRDNIIEKNHIHHIGQGALSDMGGIYTLGSQPGTIIRGNVIHDVESRHYGGHCIYTDEGSSYMLIENNICYRGNSTSFHQHYGRANTVRNNIFAKAGEEPVRVSKGELHSSVILSQNIIVADGTASYQAGYGQRDTGCFQKLCGTRNLHFNTRTDTFVCKLNDRKLSLEEVQTLFGMEYESIVANPEFANYEADDFRLMEGSSAFTLGFEPIDISNVGVTI